MGLLRRWSILLSSLHVVLMIALEVETNYYVDPAETADTINYKDPCKAGNVNVNSSSSQLSLNSPNIVVF